MHLYSFKHPKNLTTHSLHLKRGNKFLPSSGGRNGMPHATLQSLNRNTERTIRYYICLVSADHANK